EIFVPLCLDNGIELKDFNFFYQAMSDVIKKIEGLAQTGKETLIIKLPEPPGMEP
ncbi:MAG: hypothetical protein GTN82_43075, partial [Candidatus Aminicenantes bacterium]|nr:hypothetical protein [Candidatus Aminicenantes bacterium]NIN23562.1 hypothetical protein [Candidatus Aminicenantes bacterium]NIR12233.1 hypothetical protein [Candidatus Aminicenantes bacterium]